LKDISELGLLKSAKILETKKLSTKEKLEEKSFLSSFFFFKFNRFLKFVVCFSRESSKKKNSLFFSF